MEVPLQRHSLEDLGATSGVLRTEGDRMVVELVLEDGRRMVITADMQDL